MSSTAPTKYRDVLQRLRRKVSETQAIVIAGPNGIVDHIVVDTALDVDTIAAEYATLLRIAVRTSEDTGAGNLVEHILVSDKSIMIARNLTPEVFLILVSRTQDQLGRARYELKQAAWELRAAIS